MTDPSARPRMIIVEDEVELRGALLEMLESAGYEVVGITDNGLEAITLAERAKPDLMLVDYRMPGADGVTVTRAVKRSARTVMRCSNDRAGRSRRLAQRVICRMVARPRSSARSSSGALTISALS